MRTHLTSRMKRGCPLSESSRCGSAPVLQAALAILVPAILMLVGCGRPALPTARPTKSATAQPEQTNSTKEMADLLQSTAASINPGDLPFLVNEERAKLIRAAMLRTDDFALRTHLHLNLASELLNAGQTDQAIEEFSTLESEIKAGDPTMWERVKYTVQTRQAFAYMRLGEQQNCCSINTAQSCLLPIRGTGIHSRQQGSTRAIQLLGALLREHPKDLKLRWLFNIAMMTVGKYPSGVPAQWLIPPATFESEYPLKQFTNVAPQLGLNILGRSGGVIVDDLDGDGNLDIMVSAIGFQDQLKFYHNNGDGTFSDRTAAAGLTGEMGGLNLIQADYDNDGNTDVLVLRGGWMGKAGRFPPSLLHNNGDGTFTDVTKRAGLLRAGPTQTAVWLDYDNDGKLDLFLGYESGEFGTNPCVLYHNNGDGTFTDVSEKAAVNFVGYVKSVVSADYDKDGWPDLFLTIGGNKGGPCVLFHNNRNGTFTNVAESAGITAPRHSFGSFFFDYDNDGWPDLFVVGYKVEGVQDVAADYLHLPSQGEKSHLYHNNRNGTFTDVTKSAHLDRVILGMGINFGDLDNDGYPDIYVGTGTPDLDMLVPNRMFRNSGGKLFQDVTTSGDFGHLQKGHAIAFADINNDGNQDIFAQMGGANYGDVAYSCLYANPGHDNSWIKLKLEGVQTNRSAIGAQICVTVRDAHGTRRIYRTVGSGASFGANPLRQEIGLGKARSIDNVQILWPQSSRTQTLRGLALNAVYVVRENEDHARRVTLRSFAWPRRTGL